MIERKDPSKSYNKENIVLISSFLNTPPIGRFLNKNISEEDRDIALKAGALGFNIDKLNEWTNYVPEKMEKIIEYERNIITELILTE